MDAFGRPGKQLLIIPQDAWTLLAAELCRDGSVSSNAHGCHSGGSIQCTPNVDSRGSSNN